MESEVDKATKEVGLAVKEAQGIVKNNLDTNTDT
jgi:hypothetical protein